MQNTTPRERLRLDGQEGGFHTYLSNVSPEGGQETDWVHLGSASGEGRVLLISLRASAIRIRTNYDKTRFIPPGTQLRLQK